MASTITAPSTTAPHLLHNDHSIQSTQAATPRPTQERKSHDVVADFNYHKDPGDGSAPHPSYVGKPETYERPAETISQVVHDIRGEEEKYSLDTTGFQVYRHVSRETAFEDDEEIKKTYYPEIEDILKDV